MGANVPGVDFITATSDGSEIIVTDVKTSEVGRFPAAKNQIPGSWQTEVDAAIARLSLEDSALEVRIRAAHRQKRVRLRQLRANYSPQGQGTIAGW
jgi:hypothetical protein